MPKVATRDEKAASIPPQIPLAVSLEKVCFRYPPSPLAQNQMDQIQPHLQWLFQDLSLKIPQGARCLLIGPNGAGKSTLLNILSGKHFIAQGQAQVLERPAFEAHFDLTERGWVGNYFAFDLDVSVEEILAHRLQAKPVDPRAVDEVLDLLNVSLNWRMHQVSQGQRRRVDLMLSLIYEPQLLLLDEAISDLDMLGRKKLLDWLRIKSEKQQKTSILATHLLSEIHTWATHVIYLGFQRVRFEGTLEEWSAQDGMNQIWDWLREDEALQKKRKV